MAKTIKTIKCPTCGSTKITETRQDYYKCDSCGVDFILDNDDININHRHFHDRPLVSGYKHIRKIIIIIFAGVFVISLLFQLLKPNSKPANNYSTYSSTQTQKEEEKILYEWSNDSKKMAFLSEDGEPLVMVIGKIKEDNHRLHGEDNTIYYAVYDLKNSKKKFIKILEDASSKTNSTGIAIREFDDKNIYVIINNRNIYQIKQDFSIQNIGEYYVKKNTELAVGLAKIEFENINDGSALKLVNNEGKQLTYLPLIDKIYKKDKFHDAKSIIPPQAKTLTAYTFSSVDDDFPDEKIRLVKYTFKDQIGYPKEKPMFGWIKDYAQYGIIYDNTPYTKKFIRPYWAEQAKIVNYEILTPDRTYFAPKVLAYNDEYILIKNKATPIEGEPSQVQLINAKTTEIELAFTPEIDRYQNNNYILKDGFIIESNDYHYLDKTGKIINTFKLSDIKMEDKK